MKRILIMIILIFVPFILFCGQEFAPSKAIYFVVPNEINIEFISSELLKEYNSDQYAIIKRYAIHYEKHELAFSIRLLISQEQNALLNALEKHNLITKKSVGNIGGLVSMLKPDLLQEHNGVVIERYLSAIGNDWQSDLLGYSIPLDSLYSKINMIISNIYSTYISTEPLLIWNQKLVDEYPDQTNIGIQLYKLLDVMIKNVRFTSDDVQSIIGVVNDTNVRVRKEANLHGEILTKVNYGEELVILDITERKTKIDDMEYPWIKVRLETEEVGWIYGRYIDISFP